VFASEVGRSLIEKRMDSASNYGTADGGVRGNETTFSIAIQPQFGAVLAPSN
jgi:hypothetical protein